MSQITTKWIADLAVTTEKIADLAITTGKVADNAVNDLKIRLRYDQFLRGRNSGDTADVNILKINSNNNIELGNLTSIGTAAANYSVSALSGSIRCLGSFITSDQSGGVQSIRATQSTIAFTGGNQTTSSGTALMGYISTETGAVNVGNLYGLTSQVVHKSGTVQSMQGLAAWTTIQTGATALALYGARFAASVVATATDVSNEMLALYASYSDAKGISATYRHGIVADVSDYDTAPPKTMIMVQANSSGVRTSSNPLEAAFAIGSTINTPAAYFAYGMDLSLWGNRAFRTADIKLGMGNLIKNPSSGAVEIDATVKVSTPTADDHAATKKYVDDKIIDRAHIANNAIDQSKLLLGNGEAIRWLDNSSNPFNVLSHSDDGSNKYLNFFNGAMFIGNFSDNSIQMINNTVGATTLIATNDGNDSVGSGEISVYTGWIPSSSSMSSANLSFSTGQNDGSGNSGNILIHVGNVNTGTRGYVSLDGAYISVNSKQIRNLAAPTADDHAATKKYVDDSISGAAGANKYLSNLESPTAINQDLLPGLTDNVNLGSAAARYIGTYSQMVYCEGVRSAAETNLNLGTANSSGLPSGALNLYTGTSTDTTGNINITTGASSGTRGNVVLGAKIITLNPDDYIGCSSKKIKNLADPTDAQDAATKAYVDLVAQGIKWKASVKAASTAAIGSLSGEQTIDNVALVAEDRVLVKNQGTSSDDGIYVVKTGAWVRATDAPQSGLSSAAVFVEGGDVNSDLAFVQTSNAPATSQVWVQFGGINSVTNYDSSIAVYSGREIQVNLATNSGLEISSGLKAKVDGVTIINDSGTLKASRSDVVRASKEYITLSSTDITNKYVTLAQTPLANSVEMHVKGSITQDQGAGAGYDYHIATNELHWDSNDLDGVLEAGDILCISYNY